MDGRAGDWGGTGTAAARVFGSIHGRTGKTSVADGRKTRTCASFVQHSSAPERRQGRQLRQRQAVLQTGRPAIYPFRVVDSNQQRGLGVP